jgi:hypothetical protein
MSNSVQPLSSSAFASLIWEIDQNAEALGPSPLNVGDDVITPAIPARLCRFASALKLLREKVVPHVWQCLHESATQKVTVIRRTEANVSGDPLGKTTIRTSEDHYVVISGPTTESMERGLLDMSDYEVLIPAHTLQMSLTEEDAIRIDGIDHDIVGIQSHPKSPNPVAWRYWCKRAA